MCKSRDQVLNLNTYLLLPGGHDPRLTAPNSPHHRQPPLFARRPTRIGASRPRLQGITPSAQPTALQPLHQPQEHPLPRIPRQQPVDQPTAGPHDLARHLDHRCEPENFLTFLRVFRLWSESLHQLFDGVGSDAAVFSLLPGLGVRIVSLCAAPQPGMILVSNPVLFALIRSAGSDRSGPRCTPTPTTTPRTAPSSGRAPAPDSTPARSSIPR